jgi:DNA repair exonuclease SbcCD nuclease subunit
MNVISPRRHQFPPPATDIRVIHSSDVHVSEGFTEPVHDGDGTAGLRVVLEAARAAAAHVTVLAGDTFEHNRLSPIIVDRVVALLSKAGMPVVILPGNHDPAMSESIWLRGGFDRIQGLAILGITHERTLPFPALDLELWGNAHRDYHDMAPLADPPPRTTRWQVAMGHGHYEPPETWHNPLRPSWLISDQMIRDTHSDYLALGHWDRAAQVGCGAVPAYYSGAPHHAKTVNLVRLTAQGEIIVSRETVQSTL